MKLVKGRTLSSLLAERKPIGNATAGVGGRCPP
jgi:hypothetical protein